MGGCHSSSHLRAGDSHGDSPRQERQTQTQILETFTHEDEMIAFNETKLRGMIAHAEDAMAVVKAGDESYSVITKPVRVREFELIIQLERELLAMLEARSVGLEAIQKWGVPRQLEKVREECLELALAITHYLDGRGDLDSMASEAADVENMIAQLRIIIGAPKIDKWFQHKLTRTLHRIRNA